MFGLGKSEKDIFPDEYKGFKLISITPVSDCNSVGIYLRHQKTGLEVFHLLNEDEENLFAFAFRTPSEDSTGVAHIIEHSVLCGSQKFPLKEPFTNLLNQSVNTFLNAMTYSDKTVYPASSVIKKDYYNLMDVYADAVFFPLLKKEAFMQEAHRLEVGDDDKYEVQGVVYNEMKGAYSSFNSVANDLQAANLLHDTCYSYDSGGDPLVIPTLTYEHYKEFYHKYYRPDNCLLFLYGNIKTKEQLDFLQEKLLDRLESSLNARNIVITKHESYPYISPLLFARETQKPYTKPIRVKATAPTVGSEGSNVSMQWLCGETRDLQSYIECSFLSEVLTNHEASPLSKALTQSKLGSDLMSCGCSAQGKQFFIVFGLQGVAPRNEKKVYKVITDTLGDLVKNGVDEKDAKAALMLFEITNREIVRNNAPYSIDLMERALNAWNYGSEPAKWLLWDAALENLKQNLQDDKKFVEHLIQKYLIDNPSCLQLIVEPKKSFTTGRLKKEQSLIKNLAKETDIQMVKAELEIMHEWQGHYEDESETKCIPCLELRDLTKKFEPIKTDITTIKMPSDDGDTKSSGDKITLFKNIDNTNGVVYTEVWFACDGLDAASYKYLPLYVYCALSCGATGVSWEELARLLATQTGGVVARCDSNPVMNTDAAKKLEKSLAQYNCIGRDWVMFGVRCLNSDIDSALSTFAAALRGYEFWDTQRLSTLVKEWKNVMNTSLLAQCNVLASLRARLNGGHSEIVNEIYKGATQLFAINEIAKENINDIAARFNSIKNALKAGGALIHISAQSTVMDTLQKSMTQFIKDAQLSPLTPKGDIDEESFRREVMMSGQKDLKQDEVFLLPGGVGYTCQTLDSSKFADSDNGASLVLSHYLSGNLLWERIRTKGGAYGAASLALDNIGKTALTTYRDPRPYNSVKLCVDCLKELAQSPLDNDALLKTIIGTYGGEITPMSPRERSGTAFMRLTSAISDKDMQERLSSILRVTPKDIVKLCEKILNNLDKKKQVIVASDNESNNDAIIVALPS